MRKKKCQNAASRLVEESDSDTPRSACFLSRIITMAAKEAAPKGDRKRPDWLTMNSAAILAAIDNSSRAFAAAMKHPSDERLRGKLKKPRAHLRRIAKSTK